MKHSLPVRIVALLAISSVTCWMLASAADPSSRNRHNLFDPIYGYDEIDAHTVSARQSFAPGQDGQKLKPINQPNRPQLFDDDKANSSPPRFSSGLPVASDQPTSNAKKATTTSSVLSSAAARPLATPSFSASPDPTRTVRRDTEQPKHWSALDNYYQKLRQSAARSQQQELTLANNYYPPIYRVLQQEEADDSLSAYKQPSSYSTPHLSFLSNARQSLGGASAADTSGFLLELLSSRAPGSDRDTGFSVHDNSAPGLSRTGGASVYSRVAETPQVHRLSEAPYDIKSARPVVALPPVDLQSIVGAPAINQNEPERSRNLEWRRLPELLLIQQQQQRIKHQQETFGDWYDHERSRELLQEEAFCGPRNYLANLAGPAALNGQLELANGPSEYPSHMGVYNGSAAADGNYLCAATWVHQQFALTLASCLRGANVGELVVRAGEWNLNKNGTVRERSMATRQVEQAFIFPRYRSDSAEHNLALLKFTKPLDYLKLDLLCPACQVPQRIRANSCWAPVRNMTISEYFDADGEGETKERKSVRMIGLPVKLIANDNDDCFHQTKVESFSLQHPNYICSAEFRGALGRARLNQTDYFGSGIYCNEGANLSLVSILHPIQSNSSSTLGFMDLSYYRPWMRKVISGRNY